MANLKLFIWPTRSATSDSFSIALAENIEQARRLLRQAMLEIDGYQEGSTEFLEDYDPIGDDADEIWPIILEGPLAIATELGITPLEHIVRAKIGQNFTPKSWPRESAGGVI